MMCKIERGEALLKPSGPFLSPFHLSFTRAKQGLDIQAFPLLATGMHIFIRTGCESLMFFLKPNPSGYGDVFVVSERAQPEPLLRPDF